MHQIFKVAAKGFLSKEGHPFQDTAPTKEELPMTVAIDTHN